MTLVEDVGGTGEPRRVEVGDDSLEGSEGMYSELLSPSISMGPSRGVPLRKGSLDGVLQPGGTGPRGMRLVLVRGARGVLMEMLAVRFQGCWGGIHPVRGMRSQTSSTEPCHTLCWSGETGEGEREFL